MYITVGINKEKETVTYSTTIIVGYMEMLLSVTKLLYYAKPYHLNHSISLPAELLEKKPPVTLFEELFYFPEEYYASHNRNHFCFNRLVDTNFNYQSEKYYEVQWKIK